MFVRECCLVRALGHSSLARLLSELHWQQSLTLGSARAVMSRSNRRKISHARVPLFPIPPKLCLLAPRTDPTIPSAATHRASCNAPGVQPPLEPIPAPLPSTPTSTVWHLPPRHTSSMMSCVCEARSLANCAGAKWKQISRGEQARSPQTPACSSFCAAIGMRSRGHSMYPS